MQVDGQLSRVGDQAQLRFRRSLSHAPEKVWRALTERDQLVTWFPHDIVGDIAAGATVTFADRDNGDSLFEGAVITADPPRLLEFMWGADRLRFELEPDANGTILTLTDTFDEYGKGARDGAGWHACLGVLEHTLDGTEPPVDANAHWRAVNAKYQEKFGAEASTIGPPEGHPVTQDS